MSYFTNEKSARPFYNAIKKYIGKRYYKVPFSYEKEAYFRIDTGKGKLLLPNMAYQNYTNIMYEWAYDSIVSMLIEGTNVPHPYYEKSKNFVHLDFVNELCKEIQKCLDELEYEIKDYNQFKCDVLYFIYRLSK